jgi:hypothetical protein
MNEERTEQCLRQVEHIRGHLWHRHSVAVNQVMVETVKPSEWWLQLNQKESHYSKIENLFGRHKKLNDRYEVLISEIAMDSFTYIGSFAYSRQYIHRTGICVTQRVLIRNRSCVPIDITQRVLIRNRSCVPIEITQRVLIRNRSCVPIEINCVDPCFLVASVCLVCFFFVFFF